MGDIYRRFIQLSTGEYIDINFLIKFGVEQQIERSIIWSEDNQGKRHTIEVIDKEWVKEYPDYVHSNKIGSELYNEVAKAELNRIMHDILNIDIV